MYVGALGTCWGVLIEWFNAIKMKKKDSRSFNTSRGNVFNAVATHGQLHILHICMREVGAR